ncbi:MAG: hypothetical protein M1839_004052 [Geoglossum umbratile]|nr:MAG: hypothetical protein M1839_004052 [Geoglossum umbratile]
MGANNGYSLSVKRIVTSTPFKFVVGKDGDTITVHSALAASHSRPLDALINGRMSEAQNGFAVLDDIDRQTFVRFCQYVYTGNYAAADPEILLDSSTIGTLDSAEQDCDIPGPLAVLNDRREVEPEFSESVSNLDNDATEWISWSSSRRNRRKEKGVHYPEETQPASPPPPQSRKSVLWTRFKELSSPIPAPPPQPCPNNEPLEDYTPVLLSHAHIYVFADKYDIPPLKMLALRKLRRTLVNFTLYPERIGDIVELARYSYANTPELSSGAVGGGADALRELVLDYLVCKVEYVVESEKFLLLMEEGGALASGIMRKIVKRID